MSRLSVLVILLLLAGCQQQETGEDAKYRCINNLRQIVAAKASVAGISELQPGAEITTNEVGQFIKGGWSAIQCPEGGVYDLGLVVGLDKTEPGDVKSAPRCSVHGSAAILLKD